MGIPTAGWKCLFQIGASPATVGNLKTAELSINGDIYDITSLGNQWKQKLGGLADYTIKLSGNFDMTDTQQASIQAAIITNPGTVITWQILPTGAGPSPKYSGTGLVKQESLKFNVSSEETISFDLEGSGPLLAA